MKASRATPAVFLDRDGTLIEDRGHLRSPSQVAFFPDTVRALRLLQKNFRLFIVTNQPGIAEGAVRPAEVARVHEFIVGRLARFGIRIEHVYCCPHRRADGCRCIKPNPHYLRRAAREHRIDLRNSFVVGDHPHDLELARNAGATGIYVLTGHGARHRDELPAGALVTSGIRKAAALAAEMAGRAGRGEDPGGVPDVGAAGLPATAAGMPDRPTASGKVRKPDVRPNPAGDRPRVDPTAYVDPAAHLIGNVHVDAGALVGPTAVLRADEPDAQGAVHPILIGRKCNVQDGAVVHALRGTRVVVGAASSLSHGVVVHGPARIGSGCFIGFRAVVFNAVLGDGVYVGSGAVVQNVRLAADALVPAGLAVLTQSQADALGQTGEEERAFMRGVVEANVGLVAGYLRGSARGPKGRR